MKDVKAGSALSESYITLCGEEEKFLEVMARDRVTIEVSFGMATSRYQEMSL